MRSTVTIDDDIAEKIMQLTEEKTKTAAINHALAEWVRLKLLQELRSLRGKLEIADDLESFRSLDARKE